MDHELRHLSHWIILIVCDWLQAEGQRYIRPQGGAPPACTDGELLTLILAHQLTQATWHERRWLQLAGAKWLSRLVPAPAQPECLQPPRPALGRGGARLPRLLGPRGAGELPPEAVVDGTPIHVRHWRRHGKHHLALPEADLGYCAAKREFFYGYRLIALVTRQGIIIDWVLIPASADERDGLDGLLADEEQWRIWANKGFLDAAAKRRGPRSSRWRW